MADLGKDYMSNNADPKNVQDLTAFVSIIRYNGVLFRSFASHKTLKVVSR